VDIPTSVTFTTSDGSALQGDNDYALFADHVASFAAGSQVQTVTVSTTADNTVEADETFIATLGGLVAGGRSVTLGGAIVATGTIHNDDAAVVSISGTAVSETNSGITSLPFNVTLSNPVDVAVSVQFSTA